MNIPLFKLQARIPDLDHIMTSKKDEGGLELDPDTRTKSRWYHGVFTVVGEYAKDNKSYHIYIICPREDQNAIKQIAEFKDKLLERITANHKKSVIEEIYSM